MAIVGAAPQKAQQTKTPPPKTAVSGGKKKEATSLFNGKFKETAPSGLNGNFLLPLEDGSTAIYAVKINRVLLLAESEEAFEAMPDVYNKVSWKERETFIVEGEVVVSNNPKCPPGYVFTWVTVDGKFDYFQKDVKAFLCATFAAEDHTAIDEDDIKAVVGPQQAAADKMVGVLVKNKKTQAGGDFGQHIWRVYEEGQAEAEAQESAS